MARFPEAEVILAAAERWRDRCLLEDGSVFTDERLWTAPNLDQLDRYFVQNLDYGEGDFIGKLKLQLEPASPGAKKLAAEMFWVMYLMVSGSTISAETKRYQIRDVWGWSGEELPADHDALGEVLASGVASTGTAYNTHRWREFRFFITLMQAWKALDAGRRSEFMSDPWAFAAWVEDQKFVEGRQLRHILLFLLFPNAFEPIVTSSHKTKISKEFRKEWGEDADAVDYRDRVALDREVLRVREQINREYDEDPAELHFYREPLSSVWRDPSKTDSEPQTETRWPPEDDAKRWLEDRFGECRYWLISPGEGARMWREFQEKGIAAIGWDYLGDLQEYKSREEVTAALAEHEGRENPTNDSLAAWQFANEMSEGDVVLAKRGTRQVLGWGRVDGEYTYEPERAEYQHVRAVRWKIVEELDLRKDQRAAVKTLTEMTPYPQWLKVVLAELEGEGPGPIAPPPDPDDAYTTREALDGLFLEPARFTEILDSLGRRKNVILQGPPGVGKTFMARRLAYAHIGRKDPRHVQLVQFHQSYAYEDFIQGWRPNEQGGFVLQDGVFYEFCKRAEADANGRPYVFVIDEINRGNLSRIFGELMMLVESDKRGPEYAIPLTYSPEDTFSVPENVHVVGLMNTADRSLAMVDYALRRRFGFIDLEPAFGSERFNEHLLGEKVPEETVERISERMEELNTTIREDTRNLGPGFEIGHSYFVPSGNEEALDDSWYKSIVNTEIVPLLREYWFDQPDRVSEAVERLLG